MQTWGPIHWIHSIRLGRGRGSQGTGAMTPLPSWISYNKRSEGIKWQQFVTLYNRIEFSKDWYFSGERSVKIAQ